MTGPILGDRRDPAPYQPVNLPGSPPQSPRSSKVDTLRGSQELNRNDVLRVLDDPGRFLRCTRAHANKILEITGGRDRIAACRMSQRLVLRHQRRCGVLDRHESARQPWMRAFSNQEGWQPVV